MKKTKAPSRKKNTPDKITGVATTYEITYPEQEDHSNVDQAVWIANLEEALAKAIAQIIRARQSETSAK